MGIERAYLVWKSTVQVKSHATANSLKSHVASVLDAVPS
jgi:hypothetical protein